MGRTAGLIEYELRHKPGKENQNEDALSRRSGELCIAQVGTDDGWAKWQGLDVDLAQI